MKRRTRVLRLALAAVLLVGIGATFAAVDDSASTANNGVSSVGIASQVDLLITPHAQTLSAGSDCRTVPAGDYVQNQDQGASALFAFIANASPGSQLRRFVCLKNSGSGTADLDLATLFDVTDLDTSCTGNEAPDDTSCGSNAAGELTSEVVVEVGVPNNIGGNKAVCDNDPGRRFLFGDPAGTPSGATAIAENVSLAPSGAIDDLPTGGTICLTVEVTYANANTTLAEANVNQSDELRFKMRFRASEV